MKLFSLRGYNTPHMSDARLAFVDVETTGLSPTMNRVIEIGIVLVEDGRVVDTLDSLVNPQEPLSPFIQSLTGISPQDLEQADSFFYLCERVHALLDGAVFVAHNAPFDYGFIRQELKRESIPFESPTLCTARLSRKMYPNYRKHDLSSIIERFGLACKRRHRAYDDARVLWDFYRKMQSDFPEVTLGM